jgi:O-antigen ligase
MEKNTFAISQIKLPTVFFIIYILLIPFESIMATHIVVMVSYATIAAFLTSIFILIYLLFKPNLLKITKTAFSWTAFFLWAGLSIYWSINRATSIYDFIFVTKHLFFLLIISSYPFNYTEKRVIRHAVIFSGLLLAGTVFFSTFQIGGASAFVRATIAKGYYRADPNQIASTLLLPICFLVVDFVDKRKFSIIDLLAAIILFATLVYTGSRGAFVAFCVATIYLIFAYYRHKKRRKIILSLVFALAGISLAISLISPQILARFADISNLDRFSSKRTIVWRESLNLVPTRPLAGYGFGTAKILTKYMSQNFKSTHNILIQSMLEEGIIGSLLMLLALIPVFTMKADSSSDRAAKSGAVSVIISGLFLYNFGHDYFWLAIILSEIANRSRFAENIGDKHTPKPQPASKPLKPRFIDM